MDQGKGLGVESLVAVVVANQGASPVGGYYLGGPEVMFGEGGFSTGRGAAQHHDGRPEETQ